PRAWAGGRPGQRARAVPDRGWSDSRPRAGEPLGYRSRRARPFGMMAGGLVAGPDQPQGRVLLGTALENHVTARPERAARYRLPPPGRGAPRGDTPPLPPP